MEVMEMSPVTVMPVGGDMHVLEEALTMTCGAIASI